MVLRIVLLISLFCAPVSLFGQSCGVHSTSWHQHPQDGYWRSWFKVEDWEPNYIQEESERTVVDEWVALVTGSYPNADCSESHISITHTTTFDHSVEIAWGGEITGAVSGQAKLWFWECQAAVGAKVDWHRTGSSKKSESLQIKVEKGVLPCMSVDFFYEIRKVHKVFRKEFADARFRCRNHKTDVLGGWLLCNNRIVTVEGIGYIESRTGWRNAKKLCECEDGVPVFSNESGQGGDGNGG